MATSWKDAPKDPQDVKDYGIDWSADLAALEGGPNLTISESVWTVTAGDVVIEQQDHTDTLSVVRLSGGTVGTPQTLNCHVTLSDGQELDADQPLTIKERINK